MDLISKLVHSVLINLGFAYLDCLLKVNMNINETK